MSKRSLSPLLVILAALPLLAGCSSLTSDPDQTVTISSALEPEDLDKSSSPSASSSSSKSCDGGKVEICHLPGGDFSKANTLCISSNAVSAHEAHGDLLCGCGKTQTVYADADRDGYGDPTRPIKACAPGDGTSSNPGDCDDADGAVHPLAVEICDGRDNDCNKVIDETDEDGDGFSPCDGQVRDCDDLRDTVHPGVLEVCNLIDDDCNGVADDGFDRDGDGFASCAGDCRDDDPTRFPILTDGWMEDVCSPILPVTPGADSLYTDQAAVVVDPGSVEARYKAWYRYGATINTEIGYATSPDGVKWTKRGVVLSRGATGAFDDARLVYPTVLRRNGLYHMWYAGYNDTFAGFKIGYATSPDGVNWTRVDGNPATSIIDPVLSTSDTGYDSRSAQAPSVLVHPTNGRYYLWYGAHDRANTKVIQVALATSADGIHWIKEGVVLPVSPGAWDAQRVNFPRVMHDGEQFEMFYAGSSSNSQTRIGYAVSTDGKVWEKKSPDGPVISLGSSLGAWNADTLYSASPTIELDDEDREVYSIFLGAGAAVAGPFQTGRYTNYRPFVAITGVDDNSSYTTADTIPFRAYVDEPVEAGRVVVTLRSDGAVVASGKPGADGYVNLPVKLPAGTHTVSLVARDAGGLESVDALTVIVSN